MSALNQVNIMGRLTAKPELKFTSNGGFPVCSFTLAVDRPFRKGSEHEKETDFFRVVAWRSTAEFVCKYFDKGDQMLLTGSLRNKQYTPDGEDKPRTQTEIVAREIFFTGSKPKSAEPVPESSAQSNSGINLDEFEEMCADQDVPF